MAKKTEAAPVPMKSPKPTIRVEVTPGTELPTVGRKVSVMFEGKVVRVEDGIDRWGDKKRESFVEVEHDPKSVEIHGGMHGEIDSMSEEEKRRIKREHPDRWREFLGGER